MEFIFPEFAVLAASAYTVFSNSFTKTVLTKSLLKKFGSGKLGGLPCLPKPPIL